MTMMLRGQPGDAAAPLHWRGQNGILPGEQPAVMDRAMFEAVRDKSLSQWSHRTIVRNKSDHLLTGLLVTMPVIV
jgi:hypothetical protein